MAATTTPTKTPAATAGRKQRFSILEGNPRKKIGAEAYGAARAKLRAKRGRAEDATCRCGQPARYWTVKPDAAEVWIAPDAKGEHHGLRFSKDPDDYVALCSACRAEDAGRSTTSTDAAVADKATAAAPKQARRSRPKRGQKAAAKKK